jgi:NAD(P)-dependent dehydrogenase (short-subunit alcohol dehydrogenase family)
MSGIGNIGSPGGTGGFGSATVRRLAQMGAKALTVRATRSPTSENSVWAKFAEFHFHALG